MQDFLKPEIKITRFLVEDIITASGDEDDTFDPDNSGEWT